MSVQVDEEVSEENLRLKIPQTASNELLNVYYGVDGVKKTFFAHQKVKSLMQSLKKNEKQIWDHVEKKKSKMRKATTTAQGQRKRKKIIDSNFDYEDDDVEDVFDDSIEVSPLDKRLYQLDHRDSVGIVNSQMTVEQLNIAIDEKNSTPKMKKRIEGISASVRLKEEQIQQIRLDREKQENSEKMTNMMNMMMLSMMERNTNAIAQAKQDVETKIIFNETFNEQQKISLKEFLDFGFPQEDALNLVSLELSLSDIKYVEIEDLKQKPLSPKCKVLIRKIKHQK
jgi:hypothetical protein